MEFSRISLNNLRPPYKCTTSCLVFSSSWHWIRKQNASCLTEAAQPSSQSPVKPARDGNVTGGPLLCVAGGSSRLPLPPEPCRLCGRASPDQRASWCCALLPLRGLFGSRVALHCCTSFPGSVPGTSALVLLFSPDGKKPHEPTPLIALLFSFSVF